MTHCVSKPESVNWGAALPKVAALLFQALLLRLAGTGFRSSSACRTPRACARRTSCPMASVDDQSTSRPGAAVRTEGGHQGQPRLEHQPSEDDGAMDGATDGAMDDVTNTPSRSVDSGGAASSTS